MKHNKIFTFLLAGVLSLGIVGCGSAGSSDSSTKQASSSVSGDLKTLRLGSPGFDDYPLLENGKLAYDKGYLEEELNAVGYTLDLVTFQEAGPAINEAYASGELDMAFYGDYPAATAYSNGVDIRLVGVADQANEHRCAGTKGLRHPDTERPGRQESYRRHRHQLPGVLETPGGCL